MEGRVAHVRELKTEIARLKADNVKLRDELESLKAHFDLALLAVEDMRNFSGTLTIVDGWNLILGSRKEARNPAELMAQAKSYVAENPDDRVWIVFDGAREGVSNDGGVRVSYTGGTGQHRADKFICDFLRMARFRGLQGRIRIKTHDKDFARDAKRLLAT